MAGRGVINFESNAAIEGAAAGAQVGNVLTRSREIRASGKRAGEAHTKDQQLRELRNQQQQTQNTLLQREADKAGAVQEAAKASSVTDPQTGEQRFDSLGFAARLEGKGYIDEANVYRRTYRQNIVGLRDYARETLFGIDNQPEYEAWRADMVAQGMPEMLFPEQFSPDGVRAAFGMINDEANKFRRFVDESGRLIQVNRITNEAEVLDKPGAGGKPTEKEALRRRLMAERGLTSPEADEVVFGAGTPEQKLYDLVFFKAMGTGMFATPEEARVHAKSEVEAQFGREGMKRVRGLEHASGPESDPLGLTETEKGIRDRLRLPKQ